MEEYNVKFKKSLGQNFLNDARVVENIVKVANLKSDSLVIEVGPGGGTMTRELAKYADWVLAYEVDETLEDELDSRLGDLDNVTIKFVDFLNADLCNDISQYKTKDIYFVSNIPYYITTPIVLKLLRSKVHFKKIVLMIQKEVGNRFAALPGSKKYGSISVFLQYYYSIKKEFYVPKEKFIPKPKVDSVVISLEEIKNKPKVNDLDFFEKIVRDSFRFKRKTIKNNLNNYDLKKVEEVLNKHNFNLTTRAEEIPVEVFVEISNELRP